MNLVYVELDRCIACFSCQQACQFQQASQNSGCSPNIFVHVDMERRKIYTGTCLQCETAPCLEVCPISGITRDPETAAVIVDKEICLECGTCVAACPFGYMHLDESIQAATKCDLCGGDPKCVQVCMANALHFESINSLAERKRKQADLRLGIRAVPAQKDKD
jgi:Fe-S-cluster-containing dehydrogenase component